MNAPKLFRVPEAAKMVGLSRQRLWLYINDGRCASVEVGGVCMVTAKEIARFKNRNRPNGRPNGSAKKGKK